MAFQSGHVHSTCHRGAFHGCSCMGRFSDNSEIGEGWYSILARIGKSLICIRSDRTHFVEQAGIIGIDYYAYRKFEIVPLNIIIYNVFSGPGKGPNVYGTEPWWFYVANLMLNFNLLLPLALASAPLLVR
jgi:hypothetical protein